MKEPANFTKRKVEILADAEKAAKILVAEADAEKIRKVAEAEALAIQAIGVAEADAMKIKAQAIVIVSKILCGYKKN